MLEITIGSKKQQNLIYEGITMLKFETDRLIVRKFENSDMEALYQLLKDKEVNTFLPWFPIKTERKREIFMKNGLQIANTVLRFA